MSKDQHSTKTRLDLSNRQITSIKVDTFNSSPQLFGLYLSNNLLGFYCKEIWCPILPKGVFKPLINLRELTLNSNYLTPSLLANGWSFEGLNNLKRLNLKDNNLTELNKDFFNQMPNLFYVNLANNNLINLPDNIFQKLNYLHFVNLHDNMLSQKQIEFFNERTKKNQENNGKFFVFFSFLEGIYFFIFFLNCWLKYPTPILVSYSEALFLVTNLYLRSIVSNWGEGRGIRRSSLYRFF